jgi:hypothetical protein
MSKSEEIQKQRELIGKIHFLHMKTLFSVNYELEKELKAAEEEYEEYTEYLWNKYYGK